LYPDLSRAKRLSFDIETHDPRLEDLGPGVYRKDGRVLGVSLCDGEGFAEYYNIGHLDCYPDERERNLRYVREALGDPSTLKIGQNLSYDVDWLENGPDAVEVKGKLASVEIAEALLCEYQQEFNLDFMGKKYLNRGKKKSAIDAFCEKRGLRGDPRQYLHMMPYQVAREYAVEDARLPIEIYDAQRPMLDEQDMGDLFDLECRLVRCLLHFRKTGVKIDADVRDRNAYKVQCRVEELQKILFARYGKFNANSTAQVARIYDSEGIKYTWSVLWEDVARNPRGEPEKGLWLDDPSNVPGAKRVSPNIDDRFYTKFKDNDAKSGFKEGTPESIKLIYELRQCESHLSKFLAGSHVKFVAPDGLIHAQYHNMRNDSYGALRGTRSGRLSMTHPNLQQQPAIGVDEYWGRMCREDFVPFDGCWWSKTDYSQIEYRFLAHFASGARV
jgi:DNA polymerase I-like protein with 3'-5' exonuclease and polymerase domains